MYIKQSHNGKLTRVFINNKILYFSYETLIAFYDGQTLYVSQNEWSKTTGKHLNDIDGGDKKNRIPHDELLRITNNYRFINKYERIE